MGEEITPKYMKKYTRIGADIPNELREDLHALIPAGLLSEIIRNLLSEFLKLQKEVGIAEPLKAILDNRIRLSILPKELKYKIKEEKKTT